MISLEFTIFTNDKNLKEVFSSYLDFLKIKGTLTHILKSQDDYKVKPHSIWVLDFRGYSSLETRELILEIRETPEYFTIPIIIVLQISSGLDRLLIKDLEFAWLLEAPIASSNILRILNKIDQFMPISEKVFTLRRSIEQKLLTKKYSSCISTINDLQLVYYNELVCNNLLGHTYLKLKKFKSALSQAKKALNKFNESLKARILVMSILQESGYKKHFNIALNKTLALPSVKYIVALAEKHFDEYEKIDQKDFVKSLEEDVDKLKVDYKYFLSALLNKNVKMIIAQELSKIFNFKAIVLNNDKDHANAIRYFKAALFFLRDNSVKYKLWMNLALTEIKQEHYKQAIQFLNKCSKCAPKGYMRHEEIKKKIRPLIPKEERKRS